MSKRSSNNLADESGRRVIAPSSSCSPSTLCPLNEVPAGCAVRIKKLNGAPEVAHRLREMGFCEEQNIRLVSQQTNVICQVCNARLGLSRTLAETIWVERLPSSPAITGG